METTTKTKVKNKEEKKSLKKKIEIELEEEVNDFLELRNLKKGDEFFECIASHFANYKYTALESAWEYNGDWHCVVKDSEGGIFQFLVSNETEKAFLPSLYKNPQIIEKSKGKIFYPIS